MAEMTKYALVSLLDKDGRLMAVQVMLHAQAHGGLAPGGVCIEAIVEATSRAIAEAALADAMFGGTQECVEAFWRRISLVPRIRIAAMRRYGLRGIGPVLTYRPPLPAGTQGFAGAP